MQPNAHDPAHRTEQRAALHRLRRAQFAEARRIRQAVADARLLTPAHLCTRRRLVPLAKARQVAMYLMRTRLTWPTPGRDVAFPSERIGQLLGHRDHSTVLYGVAMIAARLANGRQEDAYLRQMVCPPARHSPRPTRTTLSDRPRDDRGERGIVVVIDIKQTTRRNQLWSSHAVEASPAAAMAGIVWDAYDTCRRHPHVD